MTFRIRLLVVFLIGVLVPMIALVLFIRGEMTGRLTTQYERRVDARIEVIEEDLAEESARIRGALAAIRRRIADDNRFRRAAVDRVPEERRYLLDYAGTTMQLSGLSMLQIQDDEGRIVSSGHFRNEFDRLDPDLPALLSRSFDTVTLVKARAPDAPFVALAAIDSVEMGGRTFTLIAGTRASDRFLASLARGDEMTVSLVYPGGPAVPAGEPGAVMRALDVPLVDSDRGEIVTAAFRVTHDTGELRALRSNINRWFGLALLIAIVMTILLGSWLTTRISRPLVELADKTSRIDLDRLDVEFDENGGGEIGVLSRVLGAMTNRLRASAVRIKDAERRATLGELARQVNHDIKNGLTPIRNVLRHLDELARTDSGDLSRVFRERKSTLDGGMSYLENLATNYARLSRKGEAGPCDVDAIVHQVVQDLSTIGRDCVVTRLGDDAHVIADPVSLRRVIENLVNNAIESLDSPGGRVVVTTEHVVDDEGSQRVRITVEDTGHGMSEEVRSRIFDDFYTTKDSGTGLGLSIVRRLVMDLDGTIGVESEKGRGSRFVVDLPHAGVAARGRE